MMKMGATPAHNSNKQTTVFKPRLLLVMVPDYSWLYHKVSIVVICHEAKLAV